jgi:hypothetical protein
MVRIALGKPGVHPLGDQIFSDLQPFQQIVSCANAMRARKSSCLLDIVLRNRFQNLAMFRQDGIGSPRPEAEAYAQR